MFLLRIGQKLVMPLMVIVCILLIVILQLGFIFMLLALLPSIAAYYIDDDPDHTTSRTIFGCNLAATIPSIVPVFVSGLKLKHYNIGDTIANPSVWLFIYTAAAIGWVLIYLSSVIVRVFLDIQYKFRAAHLENVQVRLLEEWGDSIKPHK